MTDRVLPDELTLANCLSLFTRNCASCQCSLLGQIPILLQVIPLAISNNFGRTENFNFVSSTKEIVNRHYIDMKTAFIFDIFYPSFLYAVQHAAKPDGASVQLPQSTTNKSLHVPGKLTSRRSTLYKYYYFGKSLFCPKDQGDKLYSQLAMHLLICQFKTKM